MPEYAYIHIPFCKSKCKYCSFVSYNQTGKINNYIKALKNEIDTVYQQEKLSTLYFGGGTPSLIKKELLEEIINKFHYAENCEITLELNPDDASLKYLQELYDIGINRLSIGSQTFNDTILKLIGRRHESKDIIEAVNLAKKAGFKNISVDLIYGLPTQTIEDVKNDLEKFMKLGIQHISTYGLKIEEESFWGKNPPAVPDDDMQADMYIEINNFLEKRGFYRYEISNFARKGFESKHNLNYWNNNEYYGFGVSAHGYLEGARYSNECDLNKYLLNPMHPVTFHRLSAQEKLEEEIFLGFRKTSGINIKKIQDKFGIDFGGKYKEILDKYKSYIEKIPAGYRLNLQGILISNLILSEFLSDI